MCYFGEPDIITESLDPGLLDGLLDKGCMPAMDMDLTRPSSFPFLNFPLGDDKLGNNFLNSSSALCKTKREQGGISENQYGSGERKFIPFASLTRCL